MKRGRGRGSGRVRGRGERGGGEGRGRRDIHREQGDVEEGGSTLGSHWRRGRCPSGGGGSGPGRAEGQLVHLAEEHHRTRSGEREEGISPNTAVC